MRDEDQQDRMLDYIMVYIVFYNNFEPGPVGAKVKKTKSKPKNIFDIFTQGDVSSLHLES